MATIKDVAKLAGVSISTVSKVINKYELVSDATRTKVEAAINELNYVPNQMASSLSSKNKNRIALIVKINEHKQAIDEMNMQYIQGASKIAHELKIDFVTIFSTEIEKLSINELIIHLKSLGINGIIIYGLSKDDETLHELVTKQLFKTIVIDADFLNPFTGGTNG